MKEKLRHLWHELFYKVSPPAGVKFALTCKQVVERIDSGELGSSWTERFRLLLHLSFCRACTFYSKTSKVLSRAAREMVKHSDGSVDVERINRELLKKYGSGKASRNS